MASGAPASSDAASGAPASSDAASGAPASSDAGSVKWIHLLSCDEEGILSMDPDAAMTLWRLEGAVTIVAVWGSDRQAKTSFWAQLLGKSNGFQEASTCRPHREGLWLMSEPVKRRSADGIEYNLLCLECEGIDGYDQTGRCSVRIFSLAALLSSILIYNQMRGIDEAALDHLSLLTQLTKQIRVRASRGESSASGSGQLSPIFVWLLRDFYLDSVEENRRITPRDHLELALRPVQGAGRDIAAKNEIRDSLRALFPKRECFTLDDENDLRSDQISMEQVRPELRSGLEALTEFVLERTRPKQVGGTVLTGPVLVSMTELCLDALNRGRAPTIPYSWPIVEEAECRRAFDSAKKVFMSTLTQLKPPEETGMSKAYEEAMQKSLAAFNAGAVDATGSARKRYEEGLHKYSRRAFEESKMNEFVELDSQCSRTIKSMENKLRVECRAPSADVDKAIEILGRLCSEYEASSHGPSKWQKLAVFLRESWDKPILELAKRLIGRRRSRRDSLILECRATEDQLRLCEEQLIECENSKSQYLKQYEDVISDENKDYSSLQSICGLFEERSSSLLKTLESTKQESLDWKRKYEQVLSKKKAEEDQASSEIAILKSQSSAGETRVAAAKEKAQSAREGAEEWKRKYDIAVREARAALEKAAIAQERTSNDAQNREDALRAEFSIDLATKKDEAKEEVAIKCAEKCLIAIKSALKAAESKINSCDVEIVQVKEKVRGLREELKIAEVEVENAEAESLRVEKITGDGLQLPVIRELIDRGYWPVPI